MAWQHLPDATLKMPINTLAMEILRDFAPSGWNRDSWIKESQQRGTARGQEVERCLSEGWAWLESRGLVGWDPGQSSPNARFVTRLGKEALQNGVAKVEAGARLGMQLHPRIAELIERQFLLGEYELAVFAAMKDVEVRVRDLSGLGADAVGTKLMQAAFNPTDGILSDPESEAGERVAAMELYKGAMGVFKNPSSHRPVNYDDATEAAEIILFADLLERMLDRVQARVRSRS
jgi:uncharacterized protein (TIGR02391 family)